MRNFITRVFIILVRLTLVVSMIVGIAWLFNYYPSNLYFIWYFLGKVLAVSFLFQLLFGEKITL